MVKNVSLRFTFSHETIFTYHDTSRILTQTSQYDIYQIHLANTSVSSLKVQQSGNPASLKKNLTHTVKNTATLWAKWKIIDLY